MWGFNQMMIRCQSAQTQKAALPGKDNGGEVHFWFGNPGPVNPTIIDPVIEEAGLTYPFYVAEAVATGSITVQGTPQIKRRPNGSMYTSGGSPVQFITPAGYGYTPPVLTSFSGAVRIGAGTVSHPITSAGGIGAISLSGTHAANFTANQSGGNWTLDSVGSLALGAYSVVARVTNPQGDFADIPMTVDVVASIPYAVQSDFNGTNNATTHTDTSGNVWTGSGSAALISTTAPYEGSASAYVSGTTSSGRWTTPNNAKYVMNREFWMEVVIRLNAMQNPLLGTLQTVLAKWHTQTVAGKSWRFVVLNNGSLQFRYSLTGGDDFIACTSAAGVITAGVNIPIAAERASDGYIRLYANGVMVAKSSEPILRAFKDNTSVLTVGAQSEGFGPSNGYFDRFRFRMMQRVGSDAGYTAPLAD
jgi:hypothetical protein